MTPFGGPVVPLENGKIATLDRGSTNGLGEKTMNMNSWICTIYLQASGVQPFIIIGSVIVRELRKRRCRASWIIGHGHQWQDDVWIKIFWVFGSLGLQFAELCLLLNISSVRKHTICFFATWFILSCDHKRHQWVDRYNQLWFGHFQHLGFYVIWVGIAASFSIQCLLDRNIHPRNFWSREKRRNWNDRHRNSQASKENRTVLDILEHF